MRVEAGEDNQRVYNDPQVVAHYAGLDYLTPCERFLFDKYIQPGAAVLDVGVGGGRTTARLSGTASRYVGLDYSAEMVRLCREKFPQLEFVVTDAADLSMFSDQAFDAIVIAFNGIDYVLPDERRRQCFRECRRVLRAGGVLIFSSHNPRAVWIRPAWDRERVRSLAERLAAGDGVFFRTVFSALTMAKGLHSMGRAITGSAARIVRRITKPAFWRGEGQVFDSSHGGLTTHCWVPERVMAELSGFGFRMVAQMGDDYPSRSSEFVTDWYYYVFQK